MKDEMEVEAEPAAQEDVPVLPFAVRVSWDHSKNTVKASNLLSDESWVDRLWNVVGPTNVERLPINDELKARADQLQSLLQIRLPRHIKTKVPPHQHEYLILRWAKEYGRGCCIYDTG